MVLSETELRQVQINAYADQQRAMAVQALAMGRVSSEELLNAKDKLMESNNATDMLIGLFADIGYSIVLANIDFDTTERETHDKQEP